MEKSKENDITPIIILNNISRIYNNHNIEVKAIDRLSLKIYPGDLIVIMGPSGSGKTTLLNLIAGIDQPTDGSIEYGLNFLNSHENNIHQQRLQKNIGIVFQFYNLLPDLTIYGNTELPMRIANQSDTNRTPRTLELLEKMGMGSKIFHRPYAISGGEQQRGAIATALINDPDIILADEPTGNVDTINTNRLLEIFHEYNIEHPKKAIIIVTHNPTLRKIANRTIVLKEGKIIKEINQNDFLNENNASKIAENKKNDTTHNSLIKNIPRLSQIQKCLKCESNAIMKTINSESIKMFENEKIGRITTICKKCNHIEIWDGIIDDN